MCEESACLVPPQEHTNRAPSIDSRLSSGHNGYGGAPVHHGEALVGFHEDALSQAAMGKAQMLLTLVLGLALAADCSEITILEYILPEAELHLCIDDRKKGWLVSITLLALAAGSLAWGILGDHLGRRRALISALSVATLFSSVATVMPTYGTFMTARFCSGMGIAGAFPLSFSYLAETCSRDTRPRYAGLLHSFWPLGAIFISILARVIMPSTGVDIVEDNREHWNSWHRFLFLSILPTVLCIVGLFWASESPRYLLEASREVEALAVYQRLHKLNKARTQYGLTELELPGRSAYRERPSSPSRNVFRHGWEQLRDSFQRISSPTLFRTTVLLAGLHLVLGLTYMGISAFSASLIKDMRAQQYAADRRFVQNRNYTGTIFNHSIENIQYTNSLFKNVTFVDLNLNHVGFYNCYIDETEFVNVKSSITFFENCTIKDSRFVDTDLTSHHFVHTHLINNTFMSLVSDCIVDFDYNVYLDELYKNTMAWAGPMFPPLVFMGFVLEVTARPLTIMILLAWAALCSIGICFLINAWMVTTLEMILKVLLMCAIHVVTLVVVEGYPCHLRCTAHGMMRSLYHLASLCGIPIYNFFSHTILILPGMFTISLLLIASFMAIKIQDNRKVLL